MADLADAVQPLLKWPGGKRKLAPRILAAFPPEAHGALYEPFVGSAAVALAARAPQGVLADVNPKLTRFHEVVRSLPYGFYRHLLTAFSCEPGWRHDYPRVRIAFNAEPWPAAFLALTDDDALAAARFLWLNKASFNGLYRENADGHFNVPPGSYETLALPTLEDVLHVSRVLAKYIIVGQDWRITVEQAPPGSRLYADPPYDPLSPTAAFTTYSRKPFTWDDQVALAHACADAVSRGVHVVASNHGTDRIRELWTGFGFTVRNVEGVKRSISCKGSGRGTAVPEVLLCSWDGVA